MRYSSILAVLFAGCIVVFGFQSSVAQKRDRPAVNPIPVSLDYQKALDRGTRRADGFPGENYWQQFAEYDIKATLVPDKNRVEGQVSILYHNNSPDTLYNLHLDLDLNMHKEGAVRNEPSEVTEAITLSHVGIRGVALETRPGRGARYIVNGTRLLIIPSTVILPGEKVDIEVHWSLDIPQAGAGGRMGYDSGNLFFLAYWYPRMAVYDDLIGWHPDPFRSRAEFYHGFGNYSIEITAPGNWVVMSTGDFLNPEEVLSPVVLERYRKAAGSDEKVNIVTANEFGAAATSGEATDMLTWKFYAEMVRDVAFSATRESFWDGARTSVGDRNGDGNEDFIQVHSFWRATAPLWSESVAYQQHSISFLSEYTGFSYPWPHMTAVEAGNIIGGGMEFPMMTIIGDYNMRGAAALYSVTLHELAHMWVPMIVSTDERRYSWIDEGYTVYHTDSGKEDYLPNMEHRRLTQQSYVRFALTGREGEMMRWSDFHYSTEAFRVASYPKPATILQALKGVLGEEVFYKVHRELFQVWGFKLMSPYDWFSFVETVSGRDLSWFWRAWYFETWSMDHGIERVRVNRRNTEITIRDKGNAPMPVHLLITRANGETVSVTHGVEPWLEGKRSVVVEVSYRDVVRIEIDPDYYFPDTDRSNNVWTR